MTGGAGAGKGCARAGRRAGLGVVAAAVALGACGPTGEAPEAAEVAPIEAEDARGASSRDEVLTVPLAADLVVHRFKGAVQGMSPDGDYRVHVEHGADEDPMKAAAVLKDVLAARGWRVTGERHFERAIEVRLARGGRPDAPEEVRALYVFQRAGRLVTCDGLAASEMADRLGEPFAALCRGVAVAPPAPPPSGGADPAGTRPAP